MNLEDLATPHQAAEIMGVTVSRIYQLIWDGKLVPTVKMPGKQFFLRKDVEKLRSAITPRKPRVGSDVAHTAT